MQIAIVLTPPTDQNFRWAAQVGVTDYVARYNDANSYEKLAATKAHAQSFGLRLAVVERYLPIDDIVHAGPAREENIEAIKTLLVNMGKLDVPVLCYNFMPACDWTRTSVTAPERGGAFTTAFDIAEMEAQPDALPARSTAEQLWANLEYFINAIVPTAEAAGVTLAMHPDDPPLPSLSGNDQIMFSPECYDRLFSLNRSPANAMCFCQGTFSEMGVDIPATIRHFGSRIGYVHFRDVIGTASNFVESFHDNGQTDMFAAMQAYADVGFAGAMRPDHVPKLDGEEGMDGYTILGRLFAVGYIRGLMDAVRSPAGK